MSTSSLDTETIVMAVRENIMHYFKGTCIESIAPAKVQYQRESQANPRYRYQREALEKRRSCLLSIQTTPIARMQYVPDSLTLFNDVLLRSTHLQAVHTGILEFMQRYLPAITVEQKGKPPKSLLDDSQFIATTLQEQSRLSDLDRRRELLFRLTGQPLPATITEAELSEYERIVLPSGSQTPIDWISARPSAVFSGQYAYYMDPTLWAREIQGPTEPF